MHEVGIVREALKTVAAYAEENKLDRISEIVMSVGELSLVIPQYLEDIYPIVVADDPQFKDTKLVIEVVPGMCECDDCDAIYNVIECEGICPDCGSQSKTVLSGKDCTIKEIHVPDEK